MRIISGNFKGKKIFQPKDLKTRPLKDLTKESIINLINHSIKFEIEADDFMIKEIKKNNINTSELIDFLSKSLESNNNYFRTHPNIKDRIQYTEDGVTKVARIISINTSRGDNPILHTFIARPQ